jgi:ribonuclease Z
VTRVAAAGVAAIASLLVLAAAAITMRPHLAADALARAAGERLATRVRTSLLDSPDLRVVVCGSGTPQADPDRVGSCLAIIAAGQVILIDSGYGSSRQLDLDGLPMQAVRAVFLTHLHSDHITDLAELVNRTWRAGRAENLPVYGPPGTKDTVDGFMLALRKDLEFRALNVGDRPAGHGAHGPLEAAPAIAHEISIAGSADRPLVWQRDGLRVDAFLVNHDPVRPAFGYRVGYRNRSITVSGDTRYHPALARHAAGTDLLVHEVYAKDFVERAIKARVAAGDARMAAEARAVMSYHTAPLEAARIADASGAACLLLTHVIPPLGPQAVRWITRRLLVDGMDAIYSGPVVVAADGMEFVLSTQANGPQACQPL